MWPTFIHHNVGIQCRNHALCNYNFTYWWKFQSWVPHTQDALTPVFNLSKIKKIPEEFSQHRYHGGAKLLSLEGFDQMTVNPERPILTMHYFVQNLTNHIQKHGGCSTKNYTHLNGFVLAFLFPPTDGSPWSIASPAQKFSSTTKIVPSNPKFTKLQICPDTLRMIPFAPGAYTDYSRTLWHIWCHLLTFLYRICLKTGIRIVMRFNHSY